MTEAGMGGPEENPSNRQNERDADSTQDARGPDVERRPLLEKVIVDQISDRKAEEIIQLLGNPAFQEQILALIPKIMNAASTLDMMPPGVGFIPMDSPMLNELKREMTPMFQEVLRSSGIIKALARHSISTDLGSMSASTLRMIEIRSTLKSMGASDEVLGRFDEIEKRVEERAKAKGSIVNDLVNLALDQGLELALHEEAEKFLKREKYPTREDFVSNQREKYESSKQLLLDLSDLFQQADPLSEHEMTKKFSVVSHFIGKEDVVADLASFLIKQEADRIYGYGV